MIYSARPRLKSRPQALIVKSRPRPLANKSPAKRTRRSLRMEPSSASAASAVAPGTPNRGQPYRGQPDFVLAKHILARIESRLPGRIRRLTVYTTGDTVVLTGECLTFYTKQLAQHIAMGVMEYEQLINHIEVRVAK